MHKIAVYHENQLRQVLLLEQESYRIGRGSDSDLVLAAAEVSGLHAKITLEGGHYYISDLKSRNGTFVNGARIEKYRLKEGTEIVIGPFSLKCTSSATLPESLHAPTPTAEDADDLATRTRAGDIAKLNPTLAMHKRTAYLRSASQTLASNNPRLVILDKMQRAVTYPLLDVPLTIGRAASCALHTQGCRLWTPALAASITWQAGNIVITRQSRWARITHNQRPVGQSQTLADGDSLMISGLEIKFFI